MNNVDDIYSKFGENFCICPFLGGFYQSHHVTNSQSLSKPSTIVPCCMIAPKNEFNLVDNNILASINQPVWKTIRQKFIEGKHREIPQCKICHDNEDLGVSSTRIGANLHYIHHCETDIIEEVETIVKNNYTVDKILSLDWYPSNYCNYSCIMCVGGASSSRMSFEIKILKQDQKIVINSTSDDFYKIIKDVEIINFAGGETMMQQQIHDIINYLVDNNLSSNKTILLLTNASTYPEKLTEKFKQFKKVVYMCSIDGVGDVIEYQRRGAKWAEVESNSLRILKHNFIGSVINLVLTAVNVLNIGDFVDWVYDNDIVNGINVTPVFRSEYLDVSSLPDELRTIAMHRINQSIDQYSSKQSLAAEQCLQVLHSVKLILDKTKFNQQNYEEFCKKIAVEDSASKKSLVQAVPEWAPYFKN